MYKLYVWGARCWFSEAAAQNLNSSGSNEVETELLDQHSLSVGE